MSFTIYNARDLDDTLFTLESNGEQITAISVQKTPIPCQDMRPLTVQGPLKGDYHADDLFIVPMAIDPHVHSRDPGHPEKETWDSLAMSARKGGVFAVCDMPNTVPPTLDKATLWDKYERAKRTSLTTKLFLGVTDQSIAHLRQTVRDCSSIIAGVKVYYGSSTGGLVFSDLSMLDHALGPENITLVFHAEDQCLMDSQERLSQATYDPTDYSIHSFLRPAEAAISATKDIIAFGESTGRKIHIAHVSTPEEVALIVAAKQRGVSVTSEVAFHHLLLDTEAYGKLQGFAKVNPPLRDRNRVKALGEAFRAGLIDCFASDHAPHTIKEKQSPHAHCPSGIPSLEFFWPLALQCAKKWEADPLLVKAMVNAKSAAIFSIGGSKTALQVGAKSQFVALKKGAYHLKPSDVQALCGHSPYVGMAMDYRVWGAWQHAQRIYSYEGTL